MRVCKECECFDKFATERDNESVCAVCGKSVNKFNSIFIG